ncbi:malate synthase A [Woodsholea maritima]|uniref:malate synthase A n=1 Tax=Woodsholea maritima TaxID=240237 RepID=UPI00035C2308|nr:malate synthase A [Woodsholea maritima]
MRGDDITLPQGVEIKGPMKSGYESILTPEALRLIADLHRRFEAERQRLLSARTARQYRLDQGEERLGFRADTADIRAAEWRVRPAPADLIDRRVEITGPVDRKMIINALNSGAKCFMADFEDASCPAWSTMIEGQINLRDANARTIDFTDEASAKAYALNAQTAVLLVRVRGWHLDEAHIQVDGQAVSGGMFDLALYLLHNHAALKAKGSGPYMYLPKLENHLEARLWALVIRQCEIALGLEAGTVRTTVLIETLPAAFEMDEILYELRDSICALNAGRWDYIFSYIKRLKASPDAILPDRAQVTMAVPFMAAYARHLVTTCHRRGAHAMGGMSAFIPVKNDDAANEAALDKVRSDKTREAQLGHDGGWVAHPALVPVALEAFDASMSGPNQLDTPGQGLASVDELLTPCAGQITEAGIKNNMDVGLRYIAAWMSGRGAVPIHNLMEDAATAEIARAQLWQWRHHGAKTQDGKAITEGYLRACLESVGQAIRAELGAFAWSEHHFDKAEALLMSLVLSKDFAEFLTLPAYESVKTIG